MRCSGVFAVIEGSLFLWLCQAAGDQTALLDGRMEPAHTPAPIDGDTPADGLHGSVQGPR